MQTKRLLHHLFTTRRSVRRYLSDADLRAIASSIEREEQTTSGEIRFCVEAALSLQELLQDITSREKAEWVFAQSRIWDTEENTGVLIYLLLADHKIEILADRGINRRVAPEFWTDLCQTMQAQFAHNSYAEGVQQVVGRVGEALRTHFPIKPGDRNELPDSVIVL